MGVGGCWKTSEEMGRSVWITSKARGSQFLKRLLITKDPYGGRGGEEFWELRNFETFPYELLYGWNFIEKK